MSRRLRFIPNRPLVEVTARTLQGRFLLRPSPGLREIFVGILARAALRYDVEVHAYVCAGNHLHALLSPADAHELAGFMRYLLINLSKEAGRLHRWRGPLLQRRYQAIPVSEEDAAQLGRLRYLLPAHGVKESLVSRVTEWPGAHCAAALLSGEAPAGVWYDRTQQHAARHRGEDAPDAEFATTYRLELAPLPCWRHLTPGIVRLRVAEMVAEIEAEAGPLRGPVPIMAGPVCGEQVTRGASSQPKALNLIETPELHTSEPGALNQLLDARGRKEV